MNIAINGRIFLFYSFCKKMDTNYFIQGEKNFYNRQIIFFPLVNKWCQVLKRDIMTKVKSIFF